MGYMMIIYYLNPNDSRFINQKLIIKFKQIDITTYLTEEFPLDITF